MLVSVWAGGLPLITTPIVNWVHAGLGTGAYKFQLAHDERILNPDFMHNKGTADTADASDTMDTACAVLVLLSIGQTLLGQLDAMVYPIDLKEPVLAGGAAVRVYEQCIALRPLKRFRLSEACEQCVLLKLLEVRA